MAPFELIAFWFFAAMALVALAVPPKRTSAGARATVAAAAAGAAIAVVITARSGSDVVRGWMPHFYLVAGYWLPGLLAAGAAHPTDFERRLIASDTRVRHLLPRLPAALAHVTETAYLLCYPLVPISFAVVWLYGTAEDTAWFWAAVLTAGYACYASLPWLVSRPPRLAGETRHAARHVGAVNVFVLRRVSHQLNTFPSGHVAVSCAAAAALARVSLPAGAAVALVALAIAVGAAAGRYHYVVDVLVGVLVAAVAMGVAGAFAGGSGL